MTLNERNKFVEFLKTTADAYNHPLTAGVANAFWDDLVNYPYHKVEEAVRHLRSKKKSFFTSAHIIEAIEARERPKKQIVCCEVFENGKMCCREDNLIRCATQDDKRELLRCEYHYELVRYKSDAELMQEAYAKTLGEFEKKYQISAYDVFRVMTGRAKLSDFVSDAELTLPVAPWDTGTENPKAGNFKNLIGANNEQTK